MLPRRGRRNRPFVRQGAETPTLPCRGEFSKKPTEKPRYLAEVLKTALYSRCFRLALQHGHQGLGTGAPRLGFSRPVARDCVFAYQPKVPIAALWQRISAKVDSNLSRIESRMNIPALSVLPHRPCRRLSSCCWQ